MSIFICPAGTKGLSLRSKRKSEQLLPVDLVRSRTYETQSCPTPQGGILTAYGKGDVQDPTLVCNYHLVSSTKEILL